MSRMEIPTAMKEKDLHVALKFINWWRDQWSQATNDLSMNRACFVNKRPGTTLT